MKKFNLHPQLQKDCHLIGKTQQALILLHKNASIPWFILVPITEEIEFLNLENSLREKIMDSCKEISDFLHSHFKIEKTNFAAIGNLVPQLHIHIVGRKKDDCCWPNPVWGNLKEEKPYNKDQLEKIMHILHNEGFY